MPRGCTLRQLKERPGWRWHGKVAPEILPPDLETNLETNAKYINEVRGLCNWVPSWSLTRKGPVKCSQNHPKPNRIVFQPMFQGRAVKLLGVYCKLDLPPPHPGCHREKWRFSERDSPFTEHVRKSWGRRLHPGWDQVDPNLKRFGLNDFRGIFGDGCSCFEETCQVSVLQMKVGVLNCDIECWDVDAPWIISPPVTFFFGVSLMCQWCPFWGCVGPSFWGWVNNYALATWRTCS